MTDFEYKIIEMYKKTGFKCIYCDINCELKEESIDRLKFVCPNCKKTYQVYLEEEEEEGMK